MVKENRSNIIKIIREIYFVKPLTEFNLYSYESSIDRILYDCIIEQRKGDKI